MLKISAICAGEGVSFRRVLAKIRDMEEKISKQNATAVQVDAGDCVVRADACVIGAGLAGLMCADALVKRGYDVCVMEADVVGHGDTPNSSGMVTFAHDLAYDRLIGKHGREVAWAFLRRSKDGLRVLRSVIDEYGIDCDLRECDMVLFATTAQGAKDIVKERDAYALLGADFEMTTETDLPFRIRNALRIPNQFMIDPEKFLLGLYDALKKAGVRFCEHTRATAPPADGLLIATREGGGRCEVRAKRFVVCTHFPYVDVPGFYFAKMFQSRSHSMIVRSDLALRDMYESAEGNGFEYRPVRGGIHIGGANIRTGKYKQSSQYNLLEAKAESVLHADREDIVRRFSAQDCITFDGLPFAGAYGTGLDGVYVVTGFNKWGFTNAAVCARVIADLFDGVQFDNIFDPKRLYMLKSPIKSAQNIGVLAAGFANLVLNTDSKSVARIRPGQGAIVVQDGRRVGVYRDGSGALHAVSAVCPHLGCSLVWNKDELTWDCPCHGSRFDIHGAILNAPSTERAHSVAVREPRVKESDGQYDRRKIGDRVFRSENYLCGGKTDCFEGWYFRHVSDVPFAFIVGVSKCRGDEHSFVQYIDAERSHYFRYPLSAFAFDREFMCIRIGNNSFSLRGVHARCEHGSVTVGADLHYETAALFRKSVWSPSVMGPFSYLPMSCNHAAISLRHGYRGTLCVGGIEMRTSGVGYIEKDYGKAFPAHYVWMHAANSETSVMCAVAWPLTFGMRGFLCVIRHGDRQYNLSLYEFARLAKFEVRDGGAEIEISKGKTRLKLRVETCAPRALRAPAACGKMGTEIYEDVNAKLCAELILDGRPVDLSALDSCAYECVS